MITILQLKDHFDSLPISNEEKESLLKLVKPSFAFRDFLKDKYEIDDMSVECLINLQIAPVREELSKGLDMLEPDDYLHIMISRIVKVVTDFAESEGFKDIEPLGLALQKLLFIGTKQ